MMPFSQEFPLPPSSLNKWMGAIVLTNMGDQDLSLRQIAIGNKSWSWMRRGPVLLKPGVPQRLETHPRRLLPGTGVEVWSERRCTLALEVEAPTLLARVAFVARLFWARRGEAVLREAGTALRVIAWSTLVLAWMKLLGWPMK